MSHEDCTDSVDALPQLPNITHLTLQNRFNNPVDHLLLSPLELRLDLHFNQPLNWLPPNLLVLIIGDQHLGDFNQSLDHLPGAIQVLQINGVFSKPLDYLPH
jgi:hypothetical protein